MKQLLEEIKTLKRYQPHDAGQAAIRLAGIKSAFEAFDKASKQTDSISRQIQQDLWKEIKKELQ